MISLTASIHFDTFRLFDINTFFFQSFFDFCCSSPIFTYSNWLRRKWSSRPANLLRRLDCLFLNVPRWPYLAMLHQIKMIKIMEVPKWVQAKKERESREKAKAFLAAEGAYRDGMKIR